MPNRLEFEVTEFTIVSIPNQDVGVGRDTQCGTTTDSGSAMCPLLLFEVRFLHDWKLEKDRTCASSRCLRQRPGTCCFNARRVESMDSGVAENEDIVAEMFLFADGGRGLIGPGGTGPSAPRRTRPKSRRRCSGGSSRC